MFSFFQGKPELAVHRGAKRMLYPGGEQEGFIPSLIKNLFICSHNSDRRNCMLQAEEKNEE